MWTSESQQCMGLYARAKIVSLKIPLSQNQKKCRMLFMQNVIFNVNSNAECKFLMQKQRVMLSLGAIWWRFCIMFKVLPCLSACISHAGTYMLSTEKVAARITSQRYRDYIKMTGTAKRLQQQSWSDYNVGLYSTGFRDFQFSEL